MPTQVQFRRGNTIQNNNFTGAAGEITVNTDDYSLRVHDGSTQGGFDVAEYSNAKVATYLGQLNTNVIPAADNVYSLGSPSNKFSELWLSGNSIFLGNIILKEEGDGLKVVVGETEVFSANASSGVESVAGQTGSISNAQIAASLINQNVSVKDFTVDGNLYVIGTTTNVTSVSVVIDDKNILLGNGATSAGQVDQGGITLAYVNAHLVYDEPADSWEFNRNLLIHGFQALTLANTTSDLNEGTNLYYTDSRVYSNVVSLGYYNKANIADLTTSNVAESTNLYFTNTRAFANLLSATTSSLSEGSNLYFNNNRAIGALTAGNKFHLDSNGLTTVLITSTDDVSEGSNLYFTNSRVYANVIDLGFYTKANIADLTTSNVNEGTNLYYTDARVYDNVVTLGFYTKANIADLNTDNVTEGTNLYFTNARVYANVEQIGYSYNTYVNTRLETKANVDDLTTSNVSEGTSLYYLDSRVYSNVVALGYYNKANIADLNTSNVAEGTNLYYLDSRVYDNVVALGFYTKANIADLTTTNVAEGTNLYFTNTRSRDSISAGTGVSYNSSTGSISIGQAVGTSNDVTFANVTVTGNLLVQGDSIEFTANTLIIEDPLFQVGVNPTGDTVDLGFFGHYIESGTGLEKHAGLFRDATDGQFKLFSNLFIEPSTIVDTGDQSYNSANLVLNFVVGKVTDISNHSTTNLSEGTNLYYTDARARDALSQGNGITYNKSTGVITANVTSVVGVVGAVSNAQIVAGIQEQNYLKNVGLTTSNTNQQVYHNFASATYRSGEYLIQMTSGTDYHVTKILVAHNGSSAFVTQYGDLFTNASLGSFDADISGSDIRVLITPANATTVVKSRITLIEV